MEENFDIVNISHQTTYYRIQREAYGWRKCSNSQARRTTSACSGSPLEASKCVLGTSGKCIWEQILSYDSCCLLELIRDGWSENKFPETVSRAKEIYGVEALRPATDSKNEATISICWWYCLYLLQNRLINSAAESQKSFFKVWMEADVRN